MAFSYIKSKLITTNTFSSLSSKKIVAVGATKNSLFMPHCSTILSSKFTRYSVVPVVGLVGVGRLQHNVNHTHCFLHTTNRFYHAKTEPKSLNWSMRVQRLMGFCGRICSFSLVFGAMFVIAICGARIQRVPYSGRFHLSLIEMLDDLLGDIGWQKFEEEHKGKLFPLSDPRTIRVQSIATKIIIAMNGGLRAGDEFTINGHLYASKDFGDKGSLLAPKSEGDKAEQGFKQRQKRDRNYIWKPATKFLNRRDWEVYVMDTSEINAVCFFGRRIVVHKGLLEILYHDEELATIIAHEIGHAVARHSSEHFVMDFVWVLIALILLIFAILNVGNSTSRRNPDGPAKLWGMFKNFISRRREEESDYIGLMLMASAGYNPKVAPRIYKRNLRNLGGEGGINSTHPSCIKRVELLNKAEVMNKALAVYKEVKAGEGVRSFV